MDLRDIFLGQQLGQQKVNKPKKKDIFWSKSPEND